MQGFVASGLQAWRHRQRMNTKRPAENEGRPEYRRTGRTEKTTAERREEGSRVENVDVDLRRHERRRTSC